MFSCRAWSGLAAVAVASACLALSGCGGGGGGGGAPTAPPAADSAASPGTSDTAAPGPTAPTPSPPTSAPATTDTAPASAEKLLALGEWAGNDERSNDPMQLAQLDTGAVFAVRQDAAGQVTRLYLGTLPAPLPRNATTEVTAFNLSSGTIGTQTWSVSIPNSNGFYVGTSQHDDLAMTRTRPVPGAALLKPLAGTWALDLRTLEGTLGAWSLSVDDSGHFRQDNAQGCKLNGHMMPVDNSLEWLSLHIVLSPGCGPHAGGQSFRGMLRREPEFYIDGYLFSAETMAGGALTADRRQALTLAGQRADVP